MTQSSASLILAAHGSREEDAIASLQRIATDVSKLLPGIEVVLAFVDCSLPKLGDILATARPGAVVVPCLLGRGKHLYEDVIKPAHSFGHIVAPSLGPDPFLARAMAEQLDLLGVTDDVPVILAAAGSRENSSFLDLNSVAAFIRRSTSSRVLIGRIGRGFTELENLIDKFRKVGSDFAIASYLLTPGTFHSYVSSFETKRTTPPLADIAPIPELLIARYNSAATTSIGPNRPCGDTCLNRSLAVHHRLL
jgi:sirohydrochlorin ferrochelatase